MLPTSASFLVTEDCNLRCEYCVTGDTKILKDDFSQKKIKNIKVGDMILGFDEFSEPHKHRRVYPTKVLKKFERKDNIIKITLENGMTLKVTKGHPILNNEYNWKSAGTFKPGQNLIILSENNSSLIKCKIVSIENLGIETVYNLETETHTYLANNFAVHNCFEQHNSNKMTKEVARKGLEYLCNNAIKNKDNYFSAMIFGGEPTLMPDIIEEIFKYGLELANKNNMVFTTSMVTNATILTSEIKRIINTYKNKVNLSVQLSVDGIKEVQDMYRVTKNGKGSFDIVEKNIPEWKSLFADNMDQLSIHGCCNANTLKYLYENYIYFREVWDIPRIWFMPIHSEQWTEEHVELYKEQLNKITDYILEDVDKTKNIKEVENYAPIDRCLHPDAFPSAPCGAGKNFITITAKGEIYPCHQIYFNDPEKTTKIGDLDIGIDEMKRKIFLEYDNNDLSCAKLDPECDAYHCYRCIGENWIQNGSILSVVDCGGNRCKMSKVEKEIQLKVKKEIDKMGLINNNNYQKGNNPDNPACLCDARGEGFINQDAQNNSSINNGCKCGENTEVDETIAMALKLIIDKLDTLEKGQEFILKKILK